MREPLAQVRSVGGWTSGAPVRLMSTSWPGSTRRAGRPRTSTTSIPRGLRDDCAAYMVQKWAPRLDDADRFVVTLAVDDSGEATGFSCLEFEPDAIPRLDNLHIAPGTVRSGIGSTLMDAVKAGVRAAGHRQFDLLVFQTNDRARAFYERHGGAPRRNGRRPHARRLDGRLTPLRVPTQLSLRDSVTGTGPFEAPGRE